MNRLAVVVVLCLEGCIPSGALRDETNTDSSVVAMRSAILKLRPGCEFAKTEVATRDSDEAMRWLVTGCDQPLSCRDGDNDDVLCFESPPRVADFGTGRRQQAPEGFVLVGQGVEKASGGCPGGATRVIRPNRKLWAFTATNCERDFECEGAMDYVRRDLTMIGADCKETPPSVERTVRRIAIDRLALETNCPATEIQINDAASWTRGTERAFRMSACGKAYVCTTAAGRTDCKAALDQAGAPPPLVP